MVDDRWKRVESLFHAARERAPGDREAFLDDACAGDASLRSEIASLLETAGASLIDQGVEGVVARDSLTGRQLGSYAIGPLLGAGAMGEVYLARDSKLNRDVALKVLPEAFAVDASRLARFKREAQLLASLNHPNIAAIYGFEDSGGVHALILELVEGSTLADRVARGPVPIEEALAIAAQIADAFDAAHERGVIHRDLKPANIKVRTDGTVKVLDFGLAKAASREGVSPDLTEPPAMTAAAVTREGTLLGTIAYMSPEQARGSVVDKRTDIWAFGCVLYELLTGRRAFKGNDVTECIVNVMTKEADWSALPPSTPGRILELLKRCLRKDPRERLRDIGDARITREDLDPDTREAGDVSGSRRHQRIRLWIPAALALAAAAIASASVWLFLEQGQEPPAVIRTTITLPSRLELDALQTTAPLALSPDGRRLAYVGSGDGHTQLFVRALDAFDARAIDSTDGAQFPFFSPDGQWVAFFADGKLKRVALAGGAPIVVCDVPAVGRGGTWGADGTIVFAGPQSGLMRVPAHGGQPVPVNGRDSAMGARRYSWPQFLPDGRGLLATIDNDVAALSFATGEWKILLPGSQPQFSDGYLVFHAAQVREGQIDAVPFDARTMTMRGTPVPVLDGAFRSANGGAAFFAVSQTGTMIFAPGGFARALVRVDRQGRRTPLVAERRGFRFPRYSPDGRKLAVTIDPRPSQIWVYDLERGSRIPLTTSGHNLTGVWSPDGRRVAFSAGSIRWAPADGGPVEDLIARPDPTVANMNPTFWSADGRFFIFQQQVPATDYDMWLKVEGEQPRKLISTPLRDIGGRLSPDSHWIAYYSNESGRHEVYVRPFPNVNDQKWMISTTGGWTPVWSPDGRELFYMNGAALMAVPIVTGGTTFRAGKPEQLFDGPFDTTQDMNFDVAPDGSHFVMVEADPDAKPTRVNVVVNWIADLQRGASPAHP